MLYRVTLFPPDREWQCTWRGTRTLAVREARELSEALGHAVQVDEFDFKVNKETALFLANHGWEHPANLNGDLVLRLKAAQVTATTPAKKTRTPVRRRI